MSINKNILLRCTLLFAESALHFFRDTSLYSILTCHLSFYILFIVGNKLYLCFMQISCMIWAIYIFLFIFESCQNNQSYLVLPQLSLSCDVQDLVLYIFDLWAKLLLSNMSIQQQIRSVAKSSKPFSFFKKQQSWSLLRRL